VNKSTPAPAARPLTVPEAGLKLGLTAAQVDSVLDRRPDIAARLFKVGGRRIVDAETFAILRDAVAAERTGT